MEKFNNKYRISSARLQSWDYGANGAYFITICTHNRQYFFGNIVQTPLMAAPDNIVQTPLMAAPDNIVQTPLMAAPDNIVKTPLMAAPDNIVQTPLMAAPDNIVQTPLMAAPNNIVQTPLMASLRETQSTMQLNKLGQLAEKLWLQIPEHFPFVELGNFVIMPNHVHGILIINKILPTQLMTTEQTRSMTIEETRLMTTEQTQLMAIEETRLIASLQVNGGFSGDNNPMFQENISRIIRWYKGRCSFEIRKICPNFGWQSRFHDHIIRNAQSFENIQNYITNNPINWNKDKFYANS